jgi:formylglycine-generating enzyme required for sulfatase activity
MHEIVTSALPRLPTTSVSGVVPSQTTVCPTGEPADSSRSKTAESVGCSAANRNVVSNVPAGEFEMGCHAETGEDCYSDELPVHAVYVDSFHLDVYEVTNQQYCAGLNWAWAQGGLIHVSGGVVYKYGGTGYRYCDTHSADSHSRIHWDGATFTVTPGKEDHPMGEVSWYGAVAYANWRSEQEGRQPSYDLSTRTCGGSRASDSSQRMPRSRSLKLWNSSITTAPTCSRSASAGS